jgi:hypothetical protein
MLDSARHDMVDCVHSNVPRYANGPDGAQDIAAAVYGACRNQANVWQAAMKSQCMLNNPGLYSKETCAQASNDLTPEIREMIANAVVSYRAARTKSSE